MLLQTREFKSRREKGEAIEERPHPLRLIICLAQYFVGVSLQTQSGW
jgi:hypothetical protein